MKYRPEIDGLRAIAVVPVVLFHAGFSLFPGGFVGVDIFFVISGYLISSIIYKEMDEGVFSAGKFYERRAKRLLPALFVVLFACIPFAYLWQLPNEFSAFSKSIISVVTFTSNILFWLESGYFSEAAELKPLLHTWSLAIEEQFYIVFPLVLFILHRFCRAWLAMIIGASVIASFSLAWYSSTVFPDANFYLLPTRAWELGAGILISFGMRRNVWGWSEKSREFASLIGLGMIFAALIFFDEDMPLPGGGTLLPVLGTALVILTSDKNTLVGRLLSLRLLVRVGLISYSAYLWHQPIFAFARIRLYENVPDWVYGILIVTTFTLAWISWRFVEKPVREECFMPRQIVLAVSFFALVGAGTVGVGGLFISSSTLRVPEQVTQLAAWRSSISPVRDDCHSTPGHFIEPEGACSLGGGGATPIYLWGDSHGVELSWELAKALQSSGVPVKQYTGSQCMPSIGVKSNRERHCKRYNESVYAYLTEVAPHSSVVMVARWSLYFNGNRVDTGEGCIERGSSGARFPEHWEGGTEQERKAKLGKALQQTVEGLVDAGHRVVIVHPIPEPGCDVPSRLARRALFGEGKDELFSSPEAVFEQRKLSAESALTFNNSRVLSVYPGRVFCSTENNGRCLSETLEGPLYFDSNHPNLLGSKMIASRLVNRMSEAGWLVEAR
ncbi:acyltransferase family protein [Methylophaga sp.]|uniref:acyltransferase family protein n=1 Tax=Methylophaga sp. TaxID=2024840 RepID=UPI003A8D112C